MADLRKKILDGAIVVVYMALAAMPVIAMMFGIRGHTLYGVLTPTPRPALEFASVLSEQYQHRLAAWFENCLGLKGTSIAYDNAILYYVFGETKPGAMVRLGKDGVLFNTEDIDYFNRYGRALSNGAYIRNLTTQLAYVQQLLAARGQAFVPIIVPAKASIWRDKVADEWTVDLGEARPSDGRVYVRLIRALDLVGVRYIDMREKFKTSSVPRALLFGPDARHWSDYGACMAMDEVASLYAELTGRPRPAHAAELEMIPAASYTDDFDLWRLLNAMFVPLSVQTTPSMRHSAPSPLAPCPSALFVGTSFSRTLLRDVESSGLYGMVHFNSYNLAFETWPYREPIPLEPESAVWRDITFDKDLYVLELFESFLQPNSYLDLFLRDFLAELERTR